MERGYAKPCHGSFLEWAGPKEGEIGDQAFAPGNADWKPEFSWPIHPIDSGDAGSVSEQWPVTSKSNKVGKYNYFSTWNLREFQERSSIEERHRPLVQLFFAREVKILCLRLSAFCIFKKKKREYWVNINILYWYKLHILYTIYYILHIYIYKKYSSYLMIYGIWL